MTTACACYSSNVQTLHHFLGELCSSRLQFRPAASQHGPSGHTAPSGRYIPSTTLCHVPFLPARLCCAVLLYSWEARGRALNTTNSSLSILQGCHGEPQQRWCQILQQFSLLPQLFFPTQLALLSSTEDPVLKRTGKAKMLLIR